VSPHGDYALSGFHSDTIQVWDAKTGEEIGWLEGHSGPVYSLAFSSDGRLAMSASRDQTIRVWDLKTCREVSCFSDGGFMPAQAGFSADNNQIIASGPGQVRIWRIDSAETVFRFNHRGEGTFSVSLSPDARYVCWLEPEGRVALVDVASGAPARYLGEQQRTFCFSADGKFLATGDFENRVHLWHTATHQRLKEFLGHRYCVNCVVFSPDGTRLASASDDETVHLWDVQRGQAIRVFTGHRSSLWRKLSAKYGDVTVVAFSPDGHYVASGSRDTTVQVWYAEF
jgi:WD40 repeat protein